MPGTQTKPDVSSLEGLFGISQRAGGEVAEAANRIVEPDNSVWGVIKNSVKTGLVKTLDVLQRANYAVASAVKNMVDQDENTTVLGGIWSGITGETKNTFSDVFTEMGWNPESKFGKFAKGAAGFALDVLLDPTTYVTFGVGRAGVKVLTMAGERVLTKEGAILLSKGLAQKAGEEFGADFVKRAIVNMAEKSPELSKKFFEQGGMKFFGKTVISGGRISRVVHSMPGISLLDEKTLPIRNTAYALFHRDATAKFGKLPQEFADLKQKYLDIGRVKSADAIDHAIDIARANDLNQQEAEIIANAIEAKLPLADERLANAKGLFEQVLGRNRKEELRRGIEVGELPNYVPHILVEEPVKNIPYKVEGARVKLGAAKERGIGQVINPEIPTRLHKLATEAQGTKSVEEFVAKQSKSKITLPENIKSWEDFYKMSNEVVIGKGEVIKQATIKEINEAFGKEFFDPNVVNAVATRSLASARATTTRDFLREVGQKFGALADEAPSNYKAAGAKELKDMKFHPAIAEQIDKFNKSFIGDEATSNLLRTFDKIQSLWKASVTSIFPAFHGRNAISNVFLNYLDMGKAALSPAKHALSVELQIKNRALKNLEFKILKGGAEKEVAQKQLGELLSQKIMTDINGKEWTFAAIHDAIRENRVAFSNDFLGFLDIPETVGKQMKQTETAISQTKRVAQAVNPLSVENLAFKAGRKVGNAIEEQARILNFITNLEKTGDVLTSAKRTKQFLFDYQNLSDFERNVMRRLIPFYTFTRKNIELQVTQLFKDPGKFATQAKLFTNISKSMSGAALSDDERKLLPDYLQGGLGIVTARDGNNVQVVNALGTPFEQIFQAVQKNQLLSSLTPAIALPLQAAVKRNFFKDRPIDEDDNAAAFQNAPDFVKNYIGYTERKNKDGSVRPVALNPMRLFILSNMPPTARVLSSIRQLEAQNVSGKLKLMQQLTGVKPYLADLEAEAAYDEKQKYRELQDLLDKAGIVPTFTKSFIPSNK
jgi:hypothetical protein